MIAGRRAHDTDRIVVADVRKAGKPAFAELDSEIAVRDHMLYGSRDCTTRDANNGLYTDADVCASTYKSVNSDADLQSTNDVKCQFSDAAVSMTGFRGDGTMSTEVGRDSLEVRVDEFRDKMIDASLLTRDDSSGPAFRDVNTRGKDGRSSQDSATDGQP